MPWYSKSFCLLRFHYTKMIRHIKNDSVPEDFLLILVPELFFSVPQTIYEAVFIRPPGKLIPGLQHCTMTVCLVRPVFIRVKPEPKPGEFLVWPPNPSQVEWRLVWPPNPSQAKKNERTQDGKWKFRLIAGESTSNQSQRALGKFLPLKKSPKIDWGQNSHLFFWDFWGGFGARKATVRWGFVNKIRMTLKQSVGFLHLPLIWKWLFSKQFFESGLLVNLWYSS